MKCSFRLLQTIYSLILLVAVIYAILSEHGIIAMNYWTSSPKMAYYVNMYSICITFCSMFFSLKLFNFKRIRNKMQLGGGKGIRIYIRWSYGRLIVLALALWSNVFLYYAISGINAPQYCVLIVLISFVFSWPSQSQFESLHPGSLAE